jgi:hypothetical protein
MRRESSLPTQDTFILLFPIITLLDRSQRSLPILKTTILADGEPSLLRPSFPITSHPISLMLVFSMTSKSIGLEDKRTTRPPGYKSVGSKMAIEGISRMEVLSMNGEWRQRLRSEGRGQRIRRMCLDRKDQ